MKTVNSDVRYINYEVTPDLENIIINNKIFKIPDYFNKNMIRISDNKALEMIFIQIVYNKIQYYKSKIK